MHPGKDMVESRLVDLCTVEPLHPPSHLLSILGISPDPEAVKATCAKFPGIPMAFGSGQYAKAEMDFLLEIFFSDTQKIPGKRCI